MNETSDKSLTLSEQTVLDLLANSLFDAKRTIEGEINWQAVWRESYYQGVSSLAFQHVDISSFEEGLQNEIRRICKKKTVITVNNNNAHVNLGKALDEAGIRYTIIKGSASAFYYPDPLMRAMGDVDFLVDKADFEKGRELLESRGIKKLPKNHVCHEVYLSRENIRYEMHFEPAGIPNGKAGELIREYLSDLLEKCEKVETLFGEMMLPSTFHHGLIILLHVAHHMTGEGIGLRQLCDWATFENSMDEESFLAMFEEKLKACGLWDFARFGTALAIKYLGCKERSWTGEIDDAILEEMMKDIFNGGNFGQKDSNRAHESLIISNHGKNGVGTKRKIDQLFDSANHIVYNKWPISQKVKILLPVGAMVYGTRYVVRSAFGLRPKINVKTTIQQADERIALYKHFNLFEVTENDGKDSTI